MKNALYFDKGYYDTNYYAPQNSNSYCSLPSEIFKTLQIHFYTTKATQDFCIRNIEFTQIKLKPVY